MTDKHLLVCSESLNITDLVTTPPIFIGVWAGIVEAGRRINWLPDIAKMVVNFKHDSIFVDFCFVESHYAGQSVELHINANDGIEKVYLSLMTNYGPMGGPQKESEWDISDPDLFELVAEGVKQFMFNLDDYL
jgi:hypothetical protein